MSRLRYLLVLAVSSVVVGACGQQASVVVSFDGHNCSMQVNEPDAAEVSIVLRSNSGQGTWFGIGVIPPGMTLDRMVDLVAETDGIPEVVVMDLFDPTARSIEEYLPVDGVRVLWGVPLDPGRYSVWCAIPDGNYPNPAATAGIFER
jgi:hypothetical protein